MFSYRGSRGYLYWYDNGFFYREKCCSRKTRQLQGAAKQKQLRSCRIVTGMILKYLDRNGMYRFYKFSRFYRREIEPELIGSIENVFGSLSTLRATKNIGYQVAGRADS